jgi:hypothetical protein
MVFSLSWDMPLQGNSSFPQLMDLGRAAGFGFIVAAAVQGGTAGMGQEFQFGTHQAALYNAQAISGTSIFPAVERRAGQTFPPIVASLPQYPEPIAPQVFSKTPLEVKVGVRPLSALLGAPQAFDFTLQAALAKPSLPQTALGFGAEYQFGTHQKALYDSQNGTLIWAAAPTPPTVGVQVPLRSIHVQPQELNYDLTIQGWSKIPSVSTGWLVTMITAGPQLADLTLQAQLIPARPFLSQFQGPTVPPVLIGAPQADTTQIPARIFSPPAKAVPGQQQPYLVGGPSPSDSFAQQQIQGRIFAPSLPGPSHKVQPAIIFVFEQQYDKADQPQLIFVPTIYNPPIIPPPVIGPPDISVWTADATSITADTVAFTCDGADLINGGGVQNRENASRTHARPAYTVSSQNYTQPLAGAALSNNVPLPVTSPPMIYYINGIAYRSGQPI